ncbi:hypothetical protein THIOM_004469 [Candidatus Thiomargarita nelsonii]|uniref:Uncharacterized protein n=1 Tax=Candidatus Thiomargarita nelsonii TaxID=1003181 RepID=A0A176RVT0_9GAMM|nr:hypothetical protein THIOM_004469 [Candidatus Thiomargarita nelsonii]
MYYSHTDLHQHNHHRFFYDLRQSLYFLPFHPDSVTTYSRTAHSHRFRRRRWN